jgi:cyclic pyranopterin phosphate synthase
MSEFSHFNENGNAHMVDVSTKSETTRLAIASGIIRMTTKTLKLIESGGAKKGDVLGVARLAGIMGAKRTSDLIPLCHPLSLSNVNIDLHIRQDIPGIEIRASVKTFGQTGVEMEALTAVSIAALTIYDMIKAVEKTMTIDQIKLTFKDGGKQVNLR